MTRPIPIDPKRSFDGIDAKRLTTSNERFLRMLDVLKAHVAAEIEGDIERIMSTLVPEPSYHFWGSNAMGLEHFQGYAACRSYYESLFTNQSNTIERTYDRLIVDDYGIYGDGIIRVLVPGNMLHLVAADFDSTNIDPSANYVTARHSAVIVPFSEDDLMVGEDLYFDASVVVTKI